MERCDVCGDVAVLVDQGRKRLRVRDRSGDLRARVDDAVGRHDALDVGFPVARNDVDAEVVEGGRNASQRASIIAHESPA